MIDTHVLNRAARGVRSPADLPARPMRDIEKQCNTLGTDGKIGNPMVQFAL